MGNNYSILKKVSVSEYDSEYDEYDSEYDEYNEYNEYKLDGSYSVQNYTQNNLPPKIIVNTGQIDIPVVDPKQEYIVYERHDGSCIKSSKMTPLMLLAKMHNNNSEVMDKIRYICNNTPHSINEKCANSMTALMIACAQNHKDNDRIIKLLVDLGSDVNIKSSTNFTALTIAISESNIPAIKILIDSGSKIPDNVIKFIRIRDDQDVIISVLSLLKEKINIDLNKIFENGTTILFHALSLNKLKLYDFILVNGGNAHVVSQHGNILNWVLISSDSEIDINIALNKVLESKPDLNCKTQSGNTAFIQEIASFKRVNSLDIVKILINAGVDTNQKDSMGNTGLMIACKHNLTDVVEVIISNPDTNLDIKDKSQNTALGIAIIHNNISCAKMLIKKGARLSDTNDDGETPLILAVQRNNYTIAKRILKIETDINHKNKKGYTALMIASKYANTSSSIDIMKLLIEYKADINATSKKGNTPLIHAVTCADTTSTIKAIKILLAAGANPNIKNMYGTTALFFVHKIKIVNLLLDYGADLNIIHKNGYNILHYILIKNPNNTDLIKLLLMNGADPNIYNNKGENAFDLDKNNIVKEAYHKFQIKNSERNTIKKIRYMDTIRHVKIHKNKIYNSLIIMAKEFIHKVDMMSGVFEEINEVKPDLIKLLDMNTYNYIDKLNDFINIHSE